MSESAKAIFLSYASQDADAAKRICDALRAAGLDVWFDQSELRGGDAWDASIRKQVKECALFVPIISANTNARSEGYFRREWNLAVQRMMDMAEDQAFLLPVVIDDTPEAAARVPDRFRERQWSRVTDAASAKAFVARARQLASGHAGSAPMPKTSTADPTPTPSRAGTRGSWRLFGAVAAVVLAATVAAAWTIIDRNRKAAFVTQSLAQIELLSRSGKFVAAFRLARDVERAGGMEALTDELKNGYSRPVDANSTPPGATISLRSYGTSEDRDWIELGRAPLEKVRVPRGLMEWRATIPGLVPASRVAIAGTSTQISFVLPTNDPRNAGMVAVSSGDMNIGGLPGLRLAGKITLAPFLIDRTEVANREYAQFVQAGGYAREEFWKESFREGGRTVGFKEAMTRFKDATGRPGPATWKLGSPPDGEQDLPVRGISWYEAAAYAAYAGKELPTIYHWYFADTGGDLGFLPGVLLPAANFQGSGPRSGAASKAISAFGAVNMAGNVREWVSSGTDKQRYMTVGGSWTDVQYLYSDPALHSGFDRPLDAGFRCVRREDGAPLPAEARAPLTETPRIDSTKLKPVSDAEYAVYARIYEQRRVPLDARVESTDDSSPHWTLHKVSYAAGYGGERLNALLYLPKSAKPPYQAVIFMTGSNALQTKQALDNATATFGQSVPRMLALGGRAVLMPVWKGMYERSDGYDEARADRRGYYREHIVQWVSELRQSVEFLQTRPEIDGERIAFLGGSLGAMWGPVFLALEPRVKTGVLLMGGLIGPLQITDTVPPEMNPATFAPRAKAPVLMLNGRDDLIFIYETAQVPLFKLLGSPANKKKHKIVPGGHSVFGWYDEMVRDTHDWLDEQFGPITPAGQK